MALPASNVHSIPKSGKADVDVPVKLHTIKYDNIFFCPVRYMIAVEGATFTYDYTRTEIEAICRRLSPLHMPIDFDDEHGLAFISFWQDVLLTYEGARFLFREDKRAEILWRYVDDGMENEAESVQAPAAELYMRVLEYDDSHVPRFRLVACDW
jgi:hypothetical protein